MFRIYFIIGVFFFLTSCSKEEKSIDPNPIDNHLAHFGFTLIDTYVDDPTDGIEKNNYLDEVHTFSNLADILVVNPTDNLKDKIKMMDNRDVKVVFHLIELLFDRVDDNAQSGHNYDLRSDFKSRWDTFVVTNDLQNQKGSIGCFYIGEEPTWNGISSRELTQACDYVKSSLPEIPIMVVEAYPAISDLEIPMSVDWVGFDHYFIKEPSKDEKFTQEWDLLKSKRSRSDQKLVVIMDTHYIPEIHGDIAGIELSEMKSVATDYYNLAKSDTSVVAILGYFWPSGFDLPSSIGARGMPEEIKSEYIRIGKEITGK